MMGVGMSDLANLFNKYDCDKSKKHKYHEVYEPHFLPVKDKKINILEIGTFKGASTQAFHDYFPNAQIYTIDFFQRTKPENLPILNEERVHWLKADTTESTLPRKMRNEWGNIEFDFIIDDGAHWPMANLLTLKNCMPSLVEGGVYFIEDVWPMERMSFDQLNHPWLTGKPDRYNQLDNNQLLSEMDKYSIKRHDLRKKTKHPDSYIIALS